MKKKKIFCFLMLTASFINAAKLASFPEVLKPIQIAIDDSAIYIADQNQVMVYSLENYKLLRTIGGKGEGPGEFLTSPKIKIQKDDILLYSFTKFSRFTKSGKLLTEKKITGSILGDIYSINDTYIIQSMTYNDRGQQVEEINIVDKDLEKRKTLYLCTKKPRNLNDKRIIQLINPPFFVQCKANKIFLADGKKGFSIEILDSTGKTQKVVNIPFTKVKIPEEYKQMREEDFLKAYSGAQKEKVLKTIHFEYPIYFPAIRDIITDSDKIYIRTYGKMDKQDEYVILDMNGNFLEKVFLPEMQSEKFTIYKRRLYFLKDNESAEAWELHCLEIEGPS